MKMDLMLTTLRADLDKLTNHIQANYPNDEIFQSWINYYSQTGRAGLEEMINPPSLFRKQQSTDVMERKKEKKTTT